MFCACCGYLVLGFLIYKLLDWLIRKPITSTPSGERKNILITGCDTGFGNIFAKRLDSKGFTVFASCLTDKGRDELVRSCSSRLKAFLMDVREVKSIEKGKEFVEQHIKQEGLWALMNNAGIPNIAAGPAEWLRREDYQNVCSVNLFGMIDITNAFLPLIRKTKGRIVNTSSIVGRFSFPGSAPYNVSKYGVQAYSDCIRRELRSFGISVHLIEPGFHQTYLSSSGAITKAIDVSWERLPQQLKTDYGEEFYRKSKELVHYFLPLVSSSNLGEVVDCYEHAALSWFPRGRYMPGTDAKLLFWPLTFLPEWLSDFITMADPNMPIPAVAKK